jgi:DNA-binding Lrp family transcriptional regulator
MREQEKTVDLTALERHLLNDYQQGLPPSLTPYAEMAKELGVDESEVLATLAELRQRGTISRVGPVFRTGRVGASTLAAMQVPSQRLPEVAEIVNGFAEVNHNYEREHTLNLWFVATAANERQLQQALQRIEQTSGIEVLTLPMLEDYHIDLGFELQWT